MKKMLTTALALAITVLALAQQNPDTTTVTTSTTTETVDTIKVGNMIIIKKSVAINGETKTVHIKKVNTNKRFETNWAILDLGLNNIMDNTIYNSSTAMAFTGGTTFAAKDFSLRYGKSFDVNIWIVRQRLGLDKKSHINFTYALGIENKNFRFEEPVSFLPGTGPYVKRDNISFKKNKLALSYITVPVMLGVSSKQGGNGFVINAGVSLGYLYSSRNKQISEERGKQKIKGNFNLNPWKFQYVGEIGFKNFKLYGNYTPQSIFKSGLDWQPYSVGFRIGG